MTKSIKTYPVLSHPTPIQNQCLYLFYFEAASYSEITWQLTYSDYRNRVKGMYSKSNEALIEGFKT